MAIVGVSVLRPWGDAGVPQEAVTRGKAALPPAAAEAAAVGRASPAPSLAPDQIACSPAGWQLVSLDHLGTWTVRSWVPAGVVQATGPLDAGIRTVTLESPEVLAIGACAPETVDGAAGTLPGRPGRIVGAWRIRGGRATPVALDAGREETAPGVATLYRPHRGPGAEAARLMAWPAGRFVLEVEAPAATDPGQKPRPGLAWFVAIVVRGPR
jgi:hypothetical protein